MGGVEPTVRKNFADTAFWSAGVTTDKDGLAEFTVTMPENLTGWKVKVWAMGHGTTAPAGLTDPAPEDGNQGGTAARPFQDEYIEQPGDGRQRHVAARR